MIFKKSPEGLFFYVFKEIYYNLSMGGMTANLRANKGIYCSPLLLRFILIPLTKII
jgi:hypothetical protein